MDGRSKSIKYAFDNVGVPAEQSAHQAFSLNNQRIHRTEEVPRHPITLDFYIRKPLDTTGSVRIVRQQHIVKVRIRDDAVFAGRELFLHRFFVESDVQ